MGLPPSQQNQQLAFGCNAPTQTVGQLANCSVALNLYVTPKQRLSDFCLRFGTRRTVVQIHSPRPLPFGPATYGIREGQ